MENKTSEIKNSPQFVQAASLIKKLKTTPNNTEMSLLYGLYKQSTIGNINIERPGVLDIKGKAKWDAWKSRENMDQFDSEVEYIKLVNKLIIKYKLND